MDWNARRVAQVAGRINRSKALNANKTGQTDQARNNRLEMATGNSSGTPRVREMGGGGDQPSVGGPQVKSTGPALIRGGDSSVRTAARSGAR